MISSMTSSINLFTIYNYFNNLQYPINYQLEMSQIKEIRERQKLQVLPFQEQHIQEAAHLLTKTFMTMNPIWKNQNFNYEELYRFMHEKCVQAVADVGKYNNFTMSWVIVRNGKVVCVSTNYELTSYVKKLNKKPIGDVTIYAYLNDLSLEFWKNFDISQYKEGEAYYGDFIGVNPEDKDKGYTLMITEAMVKESLVKMKVNISRISNVKLAGLMIKHRGAQKLRQFSFTIHGATHKFWILKINFAQMKKRLMAKSKL